jgi:ribA/ribD-fused uncharacterized protein
MKAGSSRQIPSTSRAKKSGGTSNEIRFYRANEKPFGVFSNLFQRPLTFQGEVFATAEHAYQAGKARKKQVRDWILSAPTPGLVSMAAHGLYTWDIVPEWSKIKYDRMRAVLRAKFSQHADLREILLSTGDARLVETGTIFGAREKLPAFARQELPTVAPEWCNLAQAMLVALMPHCANWLGKNKRVTDKRGSLFAGADSLPCPAQCDWVFHTLDHDGLDGPFLGLQKIDGPKISDALARVLPQGQGQCSRDHGRRHRLPETIRNSREHG